MIRPAISNGPRSPCFAPRSWSRFIRNYHSPKVHPVASPELTRAIVPHNLHLLQQTADKSVARG